MKTADPATFDARDRLIRTAQSLYARQGVDATTPREVIAESGVGQGSLYHHFPRKHELARAAISRSAEETLAGARSLLGPQSATSADERLRSWLCKPRRALDGCRIGRLTSDPLVMSDAELKAPVAGYFGELLALLNAAFVERGEPAERAAALAATAASVVQGGYVLARATGDADVQGRAVDGLLTLLGMSGR